MNQIDHDPDEVKIDRKFFPSMWKWLWAMIAVFWIGNLYLHGFAWFIWPQIILSLGTGAILASWAIEITGNKVPSSWRTKPPR